MFKRPTKGMGIHLVTVAFLLISAVAQANRGPLGTYSETRQALAALVVSGQTALMHYRQSEHQARDENQPFIADLFNAMATSQRVMNRNFERRLNDLGGNLSACAIPASKQSTTRQNLIVAIRNEIQETDKIYPEALARIRGEGHPAVMALLKQVIRAQQL